MRILIVEDEAIVALDLEMMVEDMGHEIVATCSYVKQAMELDVQHEVALLDVHLLDGEVFPLADSLAAQGVDLIFHSGHVEADEISARYPKAMFCPKPSSFAALKRCIDGLSDRRYGRGASGGGWNESIRADALFGPDA